MLIDTHCHFDMIPNPETYIANCEACGDIVIGMTNCPKHFEMGYSHVRNFKHIRLALGFHPQMASDIMDQLPLFDQFLDTTSYIGEIGLDFSREFVQSKEQQIICLRHILSKIKGKNKLLSVHSRMAEYELLSMLKEYDIKNVIFHWYSGKLTLIHQILEQGYYFSINEAMTLSNNGQNIIRRLPKDRILTETDAPYNRKVNISNVLSYLNITELDIKNNLYTLLKRLR